MEGGMSTRYNPLGVFRDAPRMRAKMKAQTGSCVCQISMAAAPNPNMDTARMLIPIHAESHYLIDAQKITRYHQLGTAL